MSRMIRGHKVDVAGLAVENNLSLALTERTLKPMRALPVHRLQRNGGPNISASRMHRHLRVVQLRDCISNIARCGLNQRSRERAADVDGGRAAGNFNAALSGTVSGHIYAAAAIGWLEIA